MVVRNVSALASDNWAGVGAAAGASRLQPEPPIPSSRATQIRGFGIDLVCQFWWNKSVILANYLYKCVLGLSSRQTRRAHALHGRVPDPPVTAKRRYDVDSVKSTCAAPGSADI